ncbi:MAG TPA: dienelactone hydrolase family protein [Thiobacillaceae bacterium]|nr:dienelactone hydrolase family protein [Thiobacillaceae bacterium]HNA83016.1 dienelactone hydrolase family protein [Thiobacillaceae bacterium]HNF89198.1 dienelactone hydrolase family protein [Thiobacillaceae bacterium]HNH89247.1 dienelactone hydrolase family protein [Thiobacillaceae bacterium]HNI07014.1 dienelactone hydrolase family protein [Thiobacillaceae bacterium]
MQTDYLQAEHDSLVPPPAPVSRRDFLVTTLGAGFALAVQPVMAQTAIVTDSEGLSAGEIQVPTADGNMPAYRAQPASGTGFPVILVVQEIFGVHEHIKDVCRRLAKLGYQAIAPELYARQGDPRQYTTIPDILAKVVAKVPDAQVMADLDACVAWAKAHDGDTRRLGVTGFCWGGRITWLYAAHNPAVKAGVAWYGRLTSTASDMTPKHPLDLADALKGPVLGLYGGQDTGIPNDTVEKMRQALAASSNPASKASAIHLYPDAPHAFHADYRPSYRKEAAEDGWKRMREWFARHGV